MGTRNTLDKFFEADDVPTQSGGTPGQLTRNISIPAGENWHINKFGGSADIEQTEIELLYSEDNGATFINPFDFGQVKIRCLHLQNGGIQTEENLDLWFLGGTNHILQLRAKNYNNVNEAEIIGWIHGFSVVIKTGL